MGRTRGRLTVWLYAVAAATYLTDRLTKVVVERTLAGRPPIDLLPGVLRLDYTTNSGGAFGLGRSAPLLFAIATLVVSAVIVVVSVRLARLPAVAGVSWSVRAIPVEHAVTRRTAIIEARNQPINVLRVTRFYRGPVQAGALCPVVR